MTDILKVFEYNQHFVVMMNIINIARLNPPESGHKHHIIPKCWFKAHNLPVDNSKDNLVLLSYEDHCRVHKLAAMCIISSYMRSAMRFAAHMLDGSFSGMNHDEEIRRKMSESHKGKHHSEDTCRKMSESHKGQVPWNKGIHQKDIKATRKAYRQAHKDRIKAYYEAKKEQFKASAKAYYQAHKEQIKAKRSI